MSSKRLIVNTRHTKQYITFELLGSKGSSIRSFFQNLLTAPLFRIWPVQDHNLGQELLDFHLGPSFWNFTGKLSFVVDFQTAVILGLWLKTFIRDLHSGPLLQIIKNFDSRPLFLSRPFSPSVNQRQRNSFS